MILVKKKHRKTVIDAKAIPGEECIYGHHLVVMDMQLRDSKKRKMQKHNPRIKVWKLKEDKTRQEYLMRLEKSRRGIESSLGVEETVEDNRESNDRRGNSSLWSNKG